MIFEGEFSVRARTRQICTELDVNLARYFFQFLCCRKGERGQKRSQTIAVDFE
jgi:hypothetical protein